MLRQVFSVQFQRTWAAGLDPSTWVCFRLCVSVWVSLYNCVCTVCSHKMCTRAPDHKYRVFVVMWVLLHLYDTSKEHDWSRTARPQRLQLSGEFRIHSSHTPFSCVTPPPRFWKTREKEGRLVLPNYSDETYNAACLTLREKWQRWSRKTRWAPRAGPAVK